MPNSFCRQTRRGYEDGHWIDGKELFGRSSRRAPIFDPDLGRQTGIVELASADQVDECVALAKQASSEWRTSSLSRRSEVLFRLRDLLDTHCGELAAAITEEHGKVLIDSAGEVAGGIENVEFACGIPHLLKGAFSEQVSRGMDVHSVKQPLGVVAGITPFNFPAMVRLWMMSTAIACGNSFVLKPSEKDPSPTLILARLWQRAGLPDGVLTVVQGDRVAVQRILEHPDIAAASFVGSTDVAQQVYERATRCGKRVQALGGAKNHMVVLPDADVDTAADAAVSAGFGSAGERCMAVSVVVAVGAIADPLVGAIAERLPRVRVGSGTDPSAEMGPLITEGHMRRVEGYLANGALGRAKLLVDGRSLTRPGPGFYLGPSLVDCVSPGDPVYDDEIFGPVLSVCRVRTYEEALALVNSNRYANGVSIFTRDGGSARQFAVDVEVGMGESTCRFPCP